MCFQFGVKSTVITQRLHCCPFLARLRIISAKGQSFPEQHRFLSGRSKVTKFVSFTHFILKSLDSRSFNTQVDALYTDFLKAFDKVNHKFILCKLEEFGVHGDLRSPITSGVSCVPQGSHLGPLLFIISIVNFYLTSTI